MKILKPGKVEQRKFACEKCGCVYTRTRSESELGSETGNEYSRCPCCRKLRRWKDGEPYEEPVQFDMDRLIAVLQKNWVMDREFADDVARKLIANGVTFREG